MVSFRPMCSSPIGKAGWGSAVIHSLKPSFKPSGLARMVSTWQGTGDSAVGGAWAGSGGSTQAGLAAHGERCHRSPPGSPGCHQPGADEHLGLWHSPSGKCGQKLTCDPQLSLSAARDPDPHSEPSDLQSCTRAQQEPRRHHRSRPPKLHGRLKVRRDHEASAMCPEQGSPR